MGSLQSVGVGLIFSTFLFVRTMNKTGVVKYITNGLMIHSTTERNSDDSAWLDQNGDLIQILVLQSYIFFGNANSCLGYVSSMFEDLPENVVKNLSYPLPPLPKYLIIDMTLVSGLEVSSVDIFAEIVQICFRNKCRVMFTGVSPRLRYQFTLVGLKPTSDKTSANSYLRFSNNLEDALCYAEDALLKKMSSLEQKELRNSRIRSNSNADDGFLYALKEIDNQHGLDTLSTLAELRYHTTPIELQAGESLFHYEDGTPKPESERDDLYFIEFGMMKVERDSNQTTTRKSLHMKTFDMRHGGSSNMSLSELQPRTATMGREAYLLKNTGNSRSTMETRSLRLARLKPGSVIGAIGSISQLANSGEHIACSPMRLWQLKQEDIEKLEERNPRLILELFRMKAYLAAQRQEMTIHQLATLQQIMTSLAPKKPMNRLTQGAIKIASR
jgi:CRP-like cAMP-binding protein